MRKSNSNYQKNTKKQQRNVVLKLMLLGFVVVLSGCALAPGSFLENKNMAESAGFPVNYYAVTPELLADQAAAYANKSAGSREKSHFDPNSQDSYDYKVGRGDILNITVWEHPELTIPAGSQRSAQEAGNWVHSNGEIFYPYIGRVKVAGLDVSEIRELITKRLSQFIENPQIDVTVAVFRSQRVHITGEVKSPGALPITNVPLLLVEAVNAVGGLTDRADWEAVTLLRNGEEKRLSLRRLYQEGDVSQNIVLQHNDVINIEQSDFNKVFVLGEVKAPKSYPINRSGMSLAEALAEAGGMFETSANASGVFVIRQTKAGSKQVADVFQLDAKNATAYVLAEQFSLQPRDVVFVTAAPVARWNRVINQILPSITGLYSLGRFQNDVRNN